MREIKFRGKDLNTGEWAYGDLHALCDKPHIHTKKTSYPFAGKLSFVDPDTVGQFSGLYDKNGREIYEGDIVTFQEKHIGEDKAKTVTGHVVFEHCSFEVKMCDQSDGIDQYIDLWWFDTNKTLEIIGNIHDNPELLKGGDQ